MNIGKNRKSEVYQGTMAIKVIILVIIALDLEEVGWFLAHLVMSLYNHAVSCGVVIVISVIIGTCVQPSQ